MNRAEEVPNIVRFANLIFFDSGGTTRRFYHGVLVRTMVRAIPTPRLELSRVALDSPYAIMAVIETIIPTSQP
jgi:hypothetical protein